MNYFDGLEQETNVDVLWSERLEDGKMAFFTLHREGTSVVETTFASNPKWAPVSVRALTNPGPPIAKERFTKLTIKDWKSFITIETEWLDQGKFWVPIRHRNIYDLDGRKQDVRWRAGLWKFNDDIDLESLKSESFSAERLTNLNYFDDLVKEIGDEQSGRR
jgi:hypothetical protein